LIDLDWKNWILCVNGSWKAVWIELPKNAQNSQNKALLQGPEHEE
jgi:hypothetical protein